jgi:transposase
VRLIAESDAKTDRTDAETLARLGRLDPQLLRPVTHRGEQVQADLAVIRSRRGLVAARTLLINQVRGTVKASGARLPGCSSHSFPGKVAPAIPKELQPALFPLLIGIGELSKQIVALDAQIERMIDARYPEAKALQQVAGVGPLISLTFILTLADPTRFAKSRQVGAYLGLTPRQRQSGERAPQLRISKTGDGYLRQLLVQAAHYILGHRAPDSDLRRWGLKRTAVGGANAKKRTIVAVARKLAILLHHLWISGEVYMPMRTEEVAA